MVKKIRVITILCALLMLFGCGKKPIELTVDNCGDYLKFKVGGGGVGDAKYSSTYKCNGYKQIKIYGSVEGIDGYAYDDVVVTIGCYGTYEQGTGDTLEFTEFFDVKCAKDGDGTGQYTFYPELPYNTSNKEYAYDIKGKGYAIVAIEGAVTEK